MTSSSSASIDAYVHDVLRHIPRTSRDRQRIAEDVRAHLAERIDAGDPATVVITAMGNPKNVAQAYLGESPLHYAPLGRRFVAAVIDWVLCLGFPFFALLSLFALLSPDNSPGIIALTVIPTLLSLLYFPIAEAVFGQTIGKRLCGLSVVTEAGLAIGAKEAILRRIPYLLQALVVVDALFVFFGRKHQRAFEYVAGTVVVEVT